MRKRVLLAAWAAALALACLGCFDNPEAPTPPPPPPNITVCNDNSCNVNQPSPAASPGNPTAPAAFDLRVGPFGFTCPAGVPVPNNSAGVIPVGCSTAFTVTPKVPGTNNDYPVAIPGIPQWVVTVGSDSVQMTDFGGQPYNKNVLGLKPGGVTIEVSLGGQVGRWNGRVQ